MLTFRWQPNPFDCLILWQPKLFNRHKRGACHMFLEILHQKPLTKVFQKIWHGPISGHHETLQCIERQPNSTLFGGNQIFAIETKRAHVTSFWKSIHKGFLKRCHKPTF
jgi:hypothetical protein